MTPIIDLPTERVRQRLKAKALAKLVDLLKHNDAALEIALNAIYTHMQEALDDHPLLGNPDMSPNPYLLLVAELRNLAAITLTGNPAGDFQPAQPQKENLS